MVAIVLKLTVDPDDEPHNESNNKQTPLFPRERDVKKSSMKWKLPQASRSLSAPLPERYDSIPFIIVTETQRFDCPIDIKV